MQDTVSSARSDQLESVYKQLNSKDVRNMTNEEKMVRAVVTDELAQRGKLVYDPKNGEYVKAKNGQRIVFRDGKSYRINGIKMQGTGERAQAVADADYYYGGKWHPVKNATTQIDLAKKQKR